VSREELEKALKYLKAHKLTEAEIEELNRIANSEPPEYIKNMSKISWEELNRPMDI